MQRDYFKNLVRTAYDVAHGRTYTNIPLSSQIFEVLNDLLRADGQPESEKADASIVPFYEARYLMAKRFLHDSNATQVLEVAAGLSPRGLLMAMESDPPFCYVEVDQAPMVAFKRRIFSDVKILSEESLRGTNCPGWYLESGNALDGSSLARASRHFRRESPIVVLNEGFGVYLNPAERTLYTRDVQLLLGRFGGFWINPDIMTADAFTDVSDWQKIKTAWHLRVGRNLDECHFVNLKAAVDFYQNLGLSVDVHWLSEMMDELVSPERLGLSRSSVRTMLARRPLFVMKAR